MADTFFGFDTSLKNGDNLLSADDLDGLENEDEYDALNDETFGALDDASGFDDWEQQHEQYAEIAESTKHTTDLEDSLSRLVLDDGYDPLSKDSVWSFTPPNKNGDGNLFNSSILSSLQKASKSFLEHFEQETTTTGRRHHGSNDVSASSAAGNRSLFSDTPPPLSFLMAPPSQQSHGRSPVVTSAPPGLPKKICTVEELEKNLLLRSTAGAQPPPPGLSSVALHHHHHQQQQQQIPQHQHHPQQSTTPGQPTKGGPQPPQQKLPGPAPQSLLGHGPPHSPPGLGPPQQPPPFHPMFPPHMQPQQRGRPRGMILTRVAYMPPGPHPNMPGGFVRMMPPHPLLQGGHPVPINPMYLHNRQMPVNGPPFHQPSQYNFNPLNHPANAVGPHQRQQLAQQQYQMGQPPHHLMLRNRSRQRSDSMSLDDMPINRDEYAGLMTPREKQWLLNIQLLQLNTGTPYFDDYYYTVFKERKLKGNKENQMNDRNKFPNRQRRNSDRQENTTLTPRVYTPLQFENSLGKLQCGSVTAPRKIIDMDIVTPDKDADAQVASRDTRKTKQLLLELEALYTLLLHAEDITNPTAISNAEKLREIRQKQRLRELELAPTPEQKQEVLRLFKLESEPVVENQREYIARIAAGLLQDDKFTSFVNIRKGRMLLLRLLPYLTADAFSSQLLEIWSKLLLSLPVVGRRDTAGDNILPKFYPLFRRYIQASTMSDILDIVSGLVEVVKLENSRSTPLSHQGRSPLYFVVQNKFGVSALVAILVQSECLISSDKASEKQQSDWYSFVVTWAETLSSVSKRATPIEPVPAELLAKHCGRIVNLTDDKRQLLEKQITADSN